MQPKRSRARQPYLLPAVSSYSAKRLHRWSFVSTKLTIFVTAFFVLALLTTGLFARGQQTVTSASIAQLPGFNLFQRTPTATKTPLQAALVVNTPQPNEEAIAEASPAIDATELPTTTAAVPPPAVTLERFITPTPVPGGQVYYVTPGTNSVGWWMNNDIRRNHLNDSFLYAGSSEGNNHVAALRFDLRRVPRGAELVYGELRLTGLRSQGIDPEAGTRWQIQLIAEDSLPNLVLPIFSPCSVHQQHSRCPP